MTRRWVLVRRLMVAAGVFLGLVVLAPQPVTIANHDAGWTTTTLVYNADRQDNSQYCANIWQAGPPPSGKTCGADISGTPELGLMGCGHAPDHAHMNGVVGGAVLRNGNLEVSWKCTVTAGVWGAIVKDEDHGGDDLDRIQGCYDPANCNAIGLPSGDAPIDIVWEVFAKFEPA